MKWWLRRRATDGCALGCFIILAIPTFVVSVISWAFFGR